MRVEEGGESKRRAVMVRIGVCNKTLPEREQTSTWSFIA